MKKVTLLLFIMAATISSFANNLQITNLVVHQNGTTGGTVQFDISWDNSWYITTAPSNWDAVWVFVKFRDCGVTSSTVFTHGNINSALNTHTLGNLQAMTTGDGNTPSALSTSSAPQVTTLDYSGATGIMLRRNATTTGPVTTSQTGVILNITNLPSTATTLTVHVNGIEMVYCLPGDFYLGDGDGAGANFTTNGSNNRFVSSTTNTSGPMLVTSAFESTNTQSFFQLNASGGTVQSVSNIPGAWPKGQYGFYLMKYEITEGLYTEFLNTIAAASQTLHYTANMGASFRGALTSNGSNLFTCIRPDRGMNQLSWDDITAFLDWACLRPMTETEFEKAARGPIAAVTNEFVWGGITANAGNTFNNPPIEDGTETMTGGQAVFCGTCNYPTSSTPNCCTNGDGGNGPARVGIFATSASIRSTAGAGYFGAMDLSGNIREWVVAMTTTAANNTFTRQWGNGVLTSNNHDVATWPAVGSTIATGASSLVPNTIGQRGGGADDPSGYLQTSNRGHVYATTAIGANGRGTYSFGGRGAR